MNSTIPARKSIPSEDARLREAETSGKLRVLKQRLSINPLGPEDMHEGMVLLSEVGHETFDQVVRNGKVLEEVCECAHEEKATLDLLSDQVSTIASKLDTTTRLMDRIDQEMVDEFKSFRRQVHALQKEVSDLRDVTVLVAKHLGIPVP